MKKKKQEKRLTEAVERESHIEDNEEHDDDSTIEHKSSRDPKSSYSCFQDDATNERSLSSGLPEIKAFFEQRQRRLN